MTVSITVIIIVMVAVVLRSRADTDTEVELSTNLHREDPCPIRAFSLLIAPTSAFTIKNLWHNAEWMLNIRSNVDSETQRESKGTEDLLI